MKKPIFEGVCTALVTPFRRDGSLDPDMATRLLRRQEENGVRAIVLSGTTGESPTLSAEEKLRLFRLGSQSTNQLRSQRDLQRAKYRTLSEAAKRDLRKRRQQEGSWSAEL